jgi:UDP-2,4-diacetamido-2,4,6-trideoxy-beta-L-altropyranose hydrolase
VAGTVLFRSDANPQIGVGHIMRSLAIAQAWQDSGGRAVFLIAQGSPLVEDRLRSEGIEVRSVSSPPASQQDAAETSGLLAEIGVDWVVIDGFHFDLPYIDELRATGILMVLVDDHAARSRYDAEIVLNPNIFAAPSMYQSLPATGDLLLGLKYSLLRREFRNRPKREVSASPARKIVITMGGADPDNVSGRLLAAMNRVDVDGLEITLVSGASNPHESALRGVVEASRWPIQWLKDVRDMPAVLQSADAAITAPGGTCAELAALGIPMLLVTIADNHVRTGEEFAAQHLAVNLGWHTELSNDALAVAIQSFVMNFSLRRELAGNALSKVDGLGAQRVVQAMLSHKRGSGA